MTNAITRPSKPFAYRADIDGLRAVAVLAVVAFHLGFKSLEGGFLGVDIFFVISGYLITSIIEPKIRSKTFSFKSFYLKRIRRLLPPAFVTIGITFILSAFFLGASDFIDMARSSIAAVFSVSNILFFTEAGYWDTQSDLKPLLHTWSLGIEEQFYLFWPLLVYGFWKLMPKYNLGWVFVLTSVIGVIVSHLILKANPSAAFFLLPARFFEFSIGASFALMGRSQIWDRISIPLIRFLFGIFGLGTVFITMWVYKGSTPFPGLNALLPCIATGILLMAGAGQADKGSIPILGYFLEHPIMTWLGRISYSLYLVHWPVVSLMRYKVGEHLDLQHQILATGLIAILALALYYGVEQRMSARAGQSNKQTHKKVGSKKHNHDIKFAKMTGLTAILMSAVFFHVIVSSGWTWRLPNLKITPDQLLAAKVNRMQLNEEICTFSSFPDGPNCNKQKKIVVLVMGDSHEWDGINFMHAGYGHIEDVEIIRFGQVSRCKKKTLKGGELALDDPKCQARVDRLISPEIAKRIDIIAYSAHKPFFKNEIITLKLIQNLKFINKDIKLIVFGSYIVTEKPCPQLINETGDIQSCVKFATRWPEKDDDGVLYEDFKEITDVFIDRGELLCKGKQPDSCEGHTPKGDLMLVDTNHMTYDFAQYAGQKYAKTNPKLLENLIK